MPGLRQLSRPEGAEMSNYKKALDAMAAATDVPDYVPDEWSQK